MITTKHGIKFSLKLNDKKVKITPKIKNYFKECEKAIAEELDRLDIGIDDILIMTQDGIERVPFKDFYK